MATSPMVNRHRVYIRSKIYAYTCTIYSYTYYIRLFVQVHTHTYACVFAVCFIDCANARTWSPTWTCRRILYHRRRPFRSFLENKHDLISDLKVANTVFLKGVYTRIKIRFWRIRNNILTVVQTEYFDFIYYIRWFIETSVWWLMCMYLTWKLDGRTVFTAEVHIN